MKGFHAQVKGFHVQVNGFHVQVKAFSARVKGFSGRVKSLNPLILSLNAENLPSALEISLLNFAFLAVKFGVPGEDTRFSQIIGGFPQHLDIPGRLPAAAHVAQAFDSASQALRS